MWIHPVAVAQFLILIALANGTPVLAQKLLGRHLAWPLDCGLRLPDGHPLFGHSKTIRGIVLAISCCWIVASLIGLPQGLGIQIGVLAMTGDLLSSFIKRRLKMPPSSQASGLDQIPEALLPLCAGTGTLDFTIADVTAGVVVFLIGEILISRLLFRVGLRERPY